MRIHRERNRPSNEFGRLLTRVLVARDINNDDLRRRLVANGRKISKQFVGQLCIGVKNPPIGLIGDIGHVLDLPDDWVKRLWRAAAVDKGYEIGAIE
jgi:hypothetical protein